VREAGVTCNIASSAALLEPRPTVVSEATTEMTLGVTVLLKSVSVTVSVPLVLSGLLVGRAVARVWPRGRRT